MCSLNPRGSPHLDDGGEVGRAEGGRVVVDVGDVDVDRDSGEHGVGASILGSD